MRNTPLNESFALTPLGYIESDYPDKFGVPRQPGLATAAKATLVLTPPFNSPLCVRGLEAFSHLWLSFIFHRSPQEWSPLVRPPRLGGNKKTGVFASRSTHRPNRLGLSLVELVDINTQGGVCLLLKGADLVTGTPVVDIKPYLPWAEALPDARSGFAPEPPSVYPVEFSIAANSTLKQHSDADGLRQLIVQVVGQDPRPAYHSNGLSREYGMQLRDVNIRFQSRQLTDNTAIMFIIDIQNIDV
ncbi:tRNA (N6-threonylcarbamoyladenosine(37)-N6)-methyltransferase TrmO [Halomonas qinghailakensis]|uniref:tRNA (N6-threonylcarbamoyladenosine(37)-N6)-methyltransferase TrmO n=2 Tax=Halomonas TaxID=2745 RepID=A0AA46TTM3_9GAMM|nr:MULTISPECIES: tRNA (N6-threonylcarbamoyladenosine(37)-N6)-methyltransferase TrmO [Halomonas]UYO76315.1 tRNA (N6-threonylcarbamoyladenosine(37)-N6)-methyltransferase TrmO [Halomonas sp. ZZQ-149]UYV20846.1 tRNA (N6-threonylcarbamoyladenosine(37)-N6)-methyltransferase TrmO [Halomonas qaidamensis]